MGNGRKANLQKHCRKRTLVAVAVTDSVVHNIRMLAFSLDSCMKCKHCIISNRNAAVTSVRNLVDSDAKSKLAAANMKSHKLVHKQGKTSLLTCLDSRKVDWYLLSSDYTAQILEF